MKSFYIIAFYCILVTVTFSCGDTPATGEAPVPAGDHTGTPVANTAVLTSEQLKSIGIELGVIEQKQLSASLKTNGVLRVPNQNKASINSVYSGVVTALLVQPGNTVRKGQVIARVSNPDFVRVQSDYLNVSAKIGLAELEVARQKELNAGNAGALKNLQAAETELKTLRTAKSTYEQQIRLMGIPPDRLTNGHLISELSVTSPIGGVVSTVNVQLSSYVDVSTSIAEIVDNSRLHLDLFVYEKDLPKLKNNQVIHFNITNNPGKEYDAKIFSLGSSFEGDSKAVSVHASVEGDKTGLIDGMSVTAVISLSKATVPAVPDEAIITVDGQDYIFVLMDAARTGDDSSAAEQKDPGNRQFERVAVAKGTSDVGYTEITTLKPVPPQAKIVTKGAFFVSAKMTNTEGHDE